MKGYGQFCPISLSAELLCERWTLLVVRELTAGSTRFNEIRRGVPGIAPSLLTQRLRTLEDAGIVSREERSEQRSARYVLTRAGRELKPLLDLMGRWGMRWTREPGPEDLDPSLLVWSIHRGLDLEAIPREECVVRFRFDDAPVGKQQYWILRDGDDVDMCLTDPKRAVHLEVASSVKTLTDVWMGRRTARAAIRARDLRLEGEPALRRTFPSWLRLSVFAKGTSATW